MQLTWIKVDSSNIDALAMESDTLYVRFTRGDIYEYSGVPQHIFDELVSAESVGGMFHKLVRNAFPYQKLSPESARGLYVQDHEVAGEGAGS